MLAQTALDYDADDKFLIAALADVLSDAAATTVIGSWTSIEGARWLLAADSNDGDPVTGCRQVIWPDRSSHSGWSSLKSLMKVISTVWHYVAGSAS